MTVRRILFLCTGNTCRSPMAEAMLRRMAAERGIAVEARSAGLAAVNGVPVSGHSAEILADMGVENEELAKLTSQELTGELVEWSDLILTMTLSHKRGAIQQFPQAVDKIYTLKEYAGGDPAVQELIAERERLSADYQLAKALGREVDPAALQRLLALERQVPSDDIADPYGGDYETYRQSAEEIRTAIGQVLDKLARGEQDD